MLGGRRHGLGGSADRGDTVGGNQQRDGRGLGRIGIGRRIGSDAPWPRIGRRRQAGATIRVVTGQVFGLLYYRHKGPLYVAGATSDIQPRSVSVAGEGRRSVIPAGGRPAA